jgi:PPOX class probable F420-dependent enzyme
MTPTRLPGTPGATLTRASLDEHCHHEHCHHEQMRLSPGEARQRLATARVARLATVSAAGQPHLVPVTFALDDGTIYTAIDHKPKTTTRLRRLANIAGNPRVAVLADHYTDDWTQLWWSRADGHATVLTGPAATAAPIALLTARYPQYRSTPPTGPVIAITVTTWTAWSYA